MKHLFALLACCALMLSARAATPTAQSIESLLDAMHAEELNASVLRSTEATIRATLEQQLKGEAATPEKTAQLDVYRARFMDVMKDELSWDKMKPLQVQVYRETFSQEEVDGLVAFYRSPAGEAYVRKMPIAMQKSMQIMQTRMGSMMQRLSEALKDAGATMRPPKVTP